MLWVQMAIASQRPARQSFMRGEAERSEFIRRRRECPVFPLAQELDEVGPVDDGSSDLAFWPPS